MPTIAESLSSYPAEPGVYLMKDRAGDVLYVGKANNLKTRLKQYYCGHDTRVQLPYLLEKVESIDTIVVQSEKEALLLENTLIKKYQPRYNILLKDDKGYLSIKLTTKHDFPAMQLVRYKGSVPKDGMYYGPYTSSQQARAAFDMISRLFPLRQCSDAEFIRRTKPCLLYQMKRCPGPCVGLIEKKEYKEIVVNAQALLTGRSKELIVSLKKEMQQASDALKFEEAAVIVKKIDQLKKLSERQQVAFISRIDTDVIALLRTGSHVVITTLYYRNSSLVGSHHFSVDNAVQDDEEMMQSYLLQQYLHNDLPDELLLTFELQSATVVQEVFHEKKKWLGRIVTADRGVKAEMAALALANAKAHLSEKMIYKEKQDQLLCELKEILHLKSFPKRIECYDNSHLAGDEKVSAMAVFEDGYKAPKEYRKWRIRSVEEADDYAMMREVLTRRFRDEGKAESFPDLIMIDGGKGHLHVAQAALAELGIVSCSVIAIAKDQGRHDRGITEEVVYIEDEKEPIRLPVHSPILHLVQQIRDEAHRFVISFHRKRREKNIRKSVLDEVVGIGPVKKKRLLRHFGSPQAIASATIQQLMQVPGITEADAQRLKNI